MNFIFTFNDVGMPCVYIMPVLFLDFQVLYESLRRQVNPTQYFQSACGRGMEMMKTSGMCTADTATSTIYR